jgi:hypothetical protein
MRYVSFFSTCLLSLLALPTYTTTNALIKPKVSMSIGAAAGPTYSGGILGVYARYKGFEISASSWNKTTRQPNKLPGTPNRSYDDWLLSISIGGYHPLEKNTSFHYGLYYRHITFGKPSGDEEKALTRYDGAGPYIGLGYQATKHLSFNIEQLMYFYQQQSIGKKEGTIDNTLGGPVMLKVLYSY